MLLLDFPQTKERSPKSQIEHGLQHSNGFFTLGARDQSTASLYREILEMLKEPLESDKYKNVRILDNKNSIKLGNKS